MKIKKLTIIAILLITTMLILTGCEKRIIKSYTYEVETGDRIKIEINATDGYDMTSETPIKFSKDDEVISQGTFAQDYTYDMYVKNAETAKNVTIIEKKSKGNIEYIFYNYNDKEYNYIIKIKNSNTCFVLANNKSEKAARDIFEKLKFSVKNND